MTRIKPGQPFTPQPPAQQIPALPAPAPMAPYPTMQQQPQQQQAFTPTPPAAPGADLAFSNNLAQQYASQLQNQSIPGGYQPAPMAQPAAQQAPVYSQTPAPQPPQPQPQHAPHPMDAFHSMIQAWQAQHPQHVAGQNWQTQKSAWQALRPQKSAAIG